MQGWYPPLIFLGIGAMTDFSSLIANPKLILIDGDGVVAYYKNQTNKCTFGCELYFQIKSEEKKIENNLKMSLQDLITISFTFKEEEYKKGGSDEPEPTPEPIPEPSSNNAWKIAVGICVPVVVIIGIIILIIILRKKRKCSIDFNSNSKDINELKLPLE